VDITLSNEEHVALLENLLIGCDRAVDAPMVESLADWFLEGRYREAALTGLLAGDLIARPADRFVAGVDWEIVEIETGRPWRPERRIAAPAGTCDPQRPAKGRAKPARLFTEKPTHRKHLDDQIRKAIEQPAKQV